MQQETIDNKETTVYFFCQRRNGKREWPLFSQNKELSKPKKKVEDLLIQCVLCLHSRRHHHGRMQGCLWEKRNLLIPRWFHDQKQVHNTKSIATDKSETLQDDDDDDNNGKTGDLSDNDDDDDELHCHPDFPGVKSSGKGKMGDLEYFSLPYQ